MDKEKQKIHFGNAADIAESGKSTADAGLLPFQYFEHLDDSLLFDVYKISDHPEVRRAFESVWQTVLPPAGSRKIEERKNAIRCIICNLAVSIEQQKCVAISLNRNDYNRGNRYGQLFMTHGIITAMLSELETAGWIVSKIGFFHHETESKSRCTRFWATAKLGNLFYEIEPEEAVLREYNELVILHDETKQAIPYSDTKFIMQLRKDLVRFNEILQQHNIEYEPHHHVLRWQPSFLILQVTLKDSTTPRPSIPTHHPSHHHQPHHTHLPIPLLRRYLISR